MKAIQKNIQSILVLIYIQLISGAYCCAYGLPYTFEQVCYALLYTGIIGAMVLVVFIMTCMLFDIPVFKIFKRK